MKDEELEINLNGPSANLPAVRPTTYELLVRQSKKLGSGAMRAFHGLRNVLNREIPLPHTEQFMGNIQLLPKHKKKQEELDAIAQLKKRVKQSHQILASARTVFPLTIFPDSIVVDRSKITIIKRDFFWSSSVISIQIGDILNVATSIGPLFGSLNISSRVMNSVDHFQINYLWRGDAIFLKHLIQGYVIAQHSGIETDQLTREEMIETLCELGIDSEV